MSTEQTEWESTKETRERVKLLRVLMGLRIREAEEAYEKAQEAYKKARKAIEAYDKAVREDEHD